MEEKRGKLIFLDIDGTLLTKKGYIPEYTKKALYQAAQNGHMLFIASGRARNFFPKSVKELEFDGFIAAAGAFVECQGEILFHRPILKEKIIPLMEYLEEYNGVVIAETNENNYLTEKSLERFLVYIRQRRDFNEKVEQELLGSFQICENLKMVKEINKILYFDVACSAESLKEKFGADFLILPNSVTQSQDENSGEISEKGISKASGIETILKKLKRSREDVIVFGDGFNDLEMIQYAGTGVAMGNAVMELKEVADMVTDDIEENGIWNAFQALKLL